MKRSLPVFVILVASMTALPRTEAAPIAITLDTSPLIGHAAGPFALNFQLNDGSGSGNSNNSAALSAFDFGIGGSGSGLPNVVGGATGDLFSGVALVDSSFFNSFTQGFAPGSVLSFTLNLTSAVDVPFPDQFSFAVLDNSGFEIPTQGPFNALLVIDIDSAAPISEAFATDSTASPFGGGDPIDMAGPNVISTIPEPSTFGLMLVGLLGFVYARHCRITTSSLSSRSLLRRDQNESRLNNSPAVGF